jgi:hypothetical protein
MSKNMKENWNDENRDKKRTAKSLDRKKKKGKRHHVRDIMNELKNINDPDAYLDYMEDMENE